MAQRAAKATIDGLAYAALAPRPLPGPCLRQPSPGLILPEGRAHSWRVARRSSDRQPGLPYAGKLVAPVAMLSRLRPFRRASDHSSFRGSQGCLPFGQGLGRFAELHRSR